MFVSVFVKTNIENYMYYFQTFTNKNIKKYRLFLKSQCLCGFQNESFFEVFLYKSRNPGNKPGNPKLKNKYMKNIFHKSN